jgi:hypothetical protein
VDRGRAWLVILGIAAIALVAAVVGRPARASTPVSAPAGEGVAPLAWTTPAREVSATEAELFGRFNPRGPRTVLRFEYGRTKAYGHFAPPYVEEEFFGEQNQEYEEIVECLRPLTRYHYRIVAKNKFGTTYGKDRTFKTRARHGRGFREECGRRA